MASPDAPRTIGAVDRALEIIDLLEERGEVGVSELAGELDMNKGTTHSYLASLVEGQYAVRHDGKYRLSLRYVGLSETVKRRVGILDLVKGQLDELAAESGERVQFAVEEGGQAVTVARSAGVNAVNPSLGIGQYEDLHCVGMGKSMLAYFPEEKVDAIIEEHGLAEKTENTHTDRDSLMAELAGIRERGYATDEEERVRGIRCIAAPVFEDDQTVIGSISISGPVRRMTDDRLEDEILESMLQSANVIEVNSHLSG